MINERALALKRLADTVKGNAEKRMASELYVVAGVLFLERQELLENLELDLNLNVAQRQAKQAKATQSYSRILAFFQNIQKDAAKFPPLASVSCRCMALIKFRIGVMELWNHTEKAAAYRALLAPQTDDSKSSSTPDHMGLARLVDAVSKLDQAQESWEQAEKILQGWIPLAGLTIPNLETLPLPPLVISVAVGQVVGYSRHLLRQTLTDPQTLELNSPPQP